MILAEGILEEQWGMQDFSVRYVVHTAGHLLIAANFNELNSMQDLEMNTSNTGREVQVIGRMKVPIYHCSANSV